MWHNSFPLSCTSLYFPCLISLQSFVVRYLGILPFFASSCAPVFAHYSNYVLDGPFGTHRVWHIATLECISIVLVRLFRAVEQSVVLCQFLDPRVYHDSCDLLPQPFNVFYCRIDHQGFNSFVVGGVYDSPLSFVAYCCSAESTESIWKALIVGFHTTLRTVMCRH